VKKYLAVLFVFCSSVYSSDLVREVLTMTAFEKPARKELIANEHYASNEQTLIINLQESIINQTLGMGIDRENPKAMAALFLALNVVNLNAALYAAANAANGDISSAYEDADLNSALNATFNASWKIVAYAAKKAANSVGKDACSASWYGARSAAKDAFSRAVQAALSNIELKDTTKMDKTRCRFATLYILAFIAQKNSIEEHFVKAYQAFFEDIESDVNFNLSTEGILKIIADAIWNNPQQTELADNPFAVSLRNMLQG
jgi:hypothetical protein